MDSKQQSDKYIKARKRVEDIKKFYKHLTFYILINLVFIGYRIFKDIDYGSTFVEAFTDISNYKIFFWWGVILILHGVSVFGKDLLFNKEWEERKVKEYMDKN
ncbi:MULTISPECIES: 2TM domain-containing protein [Tenacibaculum]|uniref:2TM domain-containing protein n=1 Tax=Tenacibaculum aiptasiae TaxID=426481 RepID=A0A7J5APV4_9FLAO|nr:MULTISPECIES: 2TM domain-containing protein [Tenacibaculum]KAB1159635.1 2TM domain-containing protein [Tenacibaculum aiptasiae]MCF2873920.1 2TM domain-containing protein [Tenacibaculum sp. Cn5-1]MCF2934501.1 2TM domain-containing protein [Tenacibaculum sp. Cn5-34]MCG7510711.1 2TM domain-containing protein [Tenacibaculum sp. Cn5-46]